tara:strand:- start:50 stop:790 length:741 start_codon:yes stop_codon:yes gene_type:complete
MRVSQDARCISVGTAAAAAAAALRTSDNLFLKHILKKKPHHKMNQARIIRRIAPTPVPVLAPTPVPVLAPTPILQQDTDELDQQIRSGLTTIASTAAHLSHSQIKLTQWSAKDIAVQLTSLISECTAMKQKAEKLSTDLAAEEVENKRRVKEEEAKRKGQFKPVHVLEQSVIEETRKRTSKERGAGATIWQCSGADADGTCTHGNKSFQATAILRNVKKHIKLVHESTQASRDMLPYAKLDGFVVE